MLIQIKRSANTGNVPVSLANGELALNFTDQLLYYKHANGAIITIANGQSSGVGTDDYARLRANAAFAQANTANSTATGAYTQANSVTITAQAAFDKANTSNVASVAGRTGVIALNTNDVSENAAGPYYFTAAKVRANISNTTPINYDSSTGIISLAASGATATTYGNATAVATVTIDSFGRITTAANVGIAIPASAITSGTLSVARGGTGQTAITVNGSLLIANTVSGAYDVNTITPGTNITIVNDKGSITISSSGGGADQFARDQANFAFSMAVAFG